MEKVKTAPANWRGATQPSRAASTGKARPSAAATRSKSQPKQRNSKPKPSAFELGVAQARTYADSATPEQLEMRLQQLLLGATFTDAAFLIAASAHLGARFQTADVVRLMLERAKSARALEQAAQLVRDLQLQQNDALVTLLINEMVRAQQFGAAVRLAQEMVPGFEQLDPSADKPCWTPPALIQAMLRAGRFRAALKFSKQFGLLATFPAPQLVAGMLETRSWEEAVSSVMELQLFKEFPLEALAVEMMKQRQWSQAVKCMNKLPDKDDTRAKFYEALVRETAHVGDFVTSLRYLREFKLDQGHGEATLNLLRYLVDAMLHHGEFYKAIKYAIKFKLAKNPLDDAIAAAEAALAAANGEEVPPKVEDNAEYLPQYSAEMLIRKAMEGGQFHVATTYIKKLRLRERFADELVSIEKAQQNRLLEFRQYAQLRLAQFQDPALQKKLHALLGDEAEDEIVELEPIEVEVVLSEEQEIFPRKKKAKRTEQKSEEEAKPSDDEALVSVPESSKAVDKEQQEPTVEPAETAGESRFGFARASSPPPPSLPAVAAPAVEVSSAAIQSQPRSRSVPSGRSAPPPGLLNPSEAESARDSRQENAESSASGFNFADFAKSVQVSGPPPPPSSAPSPQPLEQPPQQQQFLNQQAQAMFGRPMPNGQFAGGPPGYPMPPMMPPPQQSPMFFPRGNMPPGAMQPRGYPQPPPPPASNSGGGAFDIASLAMQFHNSNGHSGSAGFGSFGGPRPPMGYPGAPPNGQQLFAGMAPPPFGVPPPPPQSTFKPSMSYTSVTTTRQKK